MYRLTLLVVLGLWPFAAGALTVKEAQACADKLFGAYERREYPKSLLDVPSIISRSYGSAYRSMSRSEKQLADQVAEEHLIDSFVKPTGQYSYEHVKVKRVEPLKHGFRADGVVWIRSPKYTGEASFTALLGSDTCSIYQVRILELYALDLALRLFLKDDLRVQRFLRD